MSGLRATLTGLLVRRAPAPAPATRSSLEWHGTWSGGTLHLQDGGVVQGRARTEVSTAAYASVRGIASNAAVLDLAVLDRDQQPQERHPIARLVNDTPNPWQSGVDFKETILTRLQWRGIAPVYIDRGPTGTGPIAGLYPLYSDEFKPVLERDSEGRESLAGWEARRHGRPVYFLPDEVMPVKFPDPNNPWTGLAPWRYALAADGLDRALRTWQQAEAESGPGPSSVVYLGDLDEETHRRGKDEFHASMYGARESRRHMVVSGPAAPSVARLGFTAAELGYLQGRKASLEEVGLAFDYPRDLLLGGSTFDNQKAAYVRLYSGPVLRSCRVLASAVDRHLLEVGEAGAAFDVSQVDALQENSDSVSTRVLQQFAAELLTVNESRTQLGYGEVPGGDVYKSGWQGSTPPPVPEEPAPDLDAEPRYIGARGLFRGRRAPVTPRQRVVLQVPQQRMPRNLTLRERQRAFDRHEGIGRDAVDVLAGRMERAVLRALRKFAARAVDRGAPTDGVLVRSAGVPGSVLLEGSRGQHRMSADDLFDSAFWTEQTRDALRPWLAALWQDGAALTAGALDVAFSTFQPEVLRAMDDRLAVLAGQVTDTTRQALERGVLEVGVEEGASIDTLASTLRDVFGDLSQRRAETIARTETVGGFNAASRTIALGAEGVVAREWLATTDPRTRDSHQALDGYRTEGLTDAYPNGVMFPGDPTGRPGETINCRCVEVYVLDDEE